MRQRGQRADHRQPAHVAGAVVALQRPDRHDHAGWNAKLPLDAGEQLGVRRHQLPGAVDAGRDDAGRGVFLEALGVEHALLAAVEGQHVLVDGEAGEGLADDLARHAGGLRLAAHRGQEGVEIAAALRGERGRGESEGDGEDEENAFHGAHITTTAHSRASGNPAFCCHRPRRRAIQRFKKVLDPRFRGDDR